MVGYADSALFDADDPLNPINRRIDIVVMNKRAEFDMRRQAGAERPQGGSAQADPAFAPEDASMDSQSVGDSAPAADELPATPPSERPRNLFDDDSQSLELRL